MANRFQSVCLMVALFMPLSVTACSGTEADVAAPEAETVGIPAQSASGTEDTEPASDDSVTSAATKESPGTTTELAPSTTTAVTASSETAKPDAGQETTTTSSEGQSSATATAPEGSSLLGEVAVACALVELGLIAGEDDLTAQDEMLAGAQMVLETGIDGFDTDGQGIVDAVATGSEPAIAAAAEQFMSRCEAEGFERL